MSHDYDSVRFGCATIKICVDGKSTVQGPVEKLQDAVDQIKDGLSVLRAAVNSSNGKWATPAPVALMTQTVRALESTSASIDLI